MPDSPQITRAKWGKMVVGETAFKDVKVFPGGAREWDWNETGTNHQAGIQIPDVEELITRGAQVVVLSRGYLNQLHVGGQVRTFLEEKKIEYHIYNTDRAVKKYNELAETTKVGGLFHSTC